MLGIGCVSSGKDIQALQAELDRVLDLLEENGDPA
jgi:hypothetical protein